jgi:type IV secretion system protein VirD4
LDEFANVGKIPDFDKKINTIRSRNISAFVILQDLAQLKAAYKDTANSIIGGCDTKLFLGGTDSETTKYFSEQLGKETIDVKNTSKSQSSNSGSYSQNFNRIGRELMTTNELATLDGRKCVLLS